MKYILGSLIDLLILQPKKVLINQLYPSNCNFDYYYYLSIYFFLPEIHAYDNSAFNPGAHEMEERRDRDSKVEVERLGYEMYNGKHENR